MSLKLLQLNVWSGSTYNLNWSKLDFDSYEQPSQTKARYQSMVKLIRHHDPDILTLNECMPTFKYCKRLASDLNYDFYARTGVAGIIVGPLHIPSSKITEGDCIMAKKELGLRPLGRKVLSGLVFGEYLSFNTDNATQCIAASVVKEGRRYVIGCTHWTASVVDDKLTREKIQEMKNTADIGSVDVKIQDEPETPKSVKYVFTAAEIEAGEAAVAKGTAMRIGEATKSVAFMDTFTSEDTTVILAGDLNTVAGTPETTYVSESGGFHQLELPHGSITWDMKNPNVVIQDRPEFEGSRGPVENKLYTEFSKRSSVLDHIFYKGSNLKCKAEICMTGELEGTVVPSDHYGILATFEH